jgi:hypothetical protein
MRHKPRLYRIPKGKGCQIRLSVYWIEAIPLPQNSHTGVAEQNGGWSVKLQPIGLTTENGAPGTIRTCDRLVRSFQGVLYLFYYQ